MKKILFLLSFLCFAVAFAQETKKTVITKRVSNPPKIDGILDDDAWFGADIAKDFVMFRPESGTPEPENKKTEIKIVYDDEAIYFGIYLYDDKPDEIPTQFATRDNFGTVDWIGVMINPNNDSQNDTEFFVQATGNQADAKSNFNDEDFSWSGVWDSEVKIVDDGWIVEIKIPYSALRFSNQEVQTWGINFHRHFADSRDQYTWNFINREVGEIQQYAGELTGIENIKPPTRLSFSPYASGAYNYYDGESTFDGSVGLDVKYGINESFTLDATLIPDFGQTAFDNLVLNLGPFEQRYQEQRPFFTEGLDLFSKGNMFYTRRIGNAPVNFASDDDLNENEEITNNPDKVNMLNAIKVSGRNKNGLGIGVFNAITERTYATIKDTITGETREIETEPLANYNVLVLDQQFNKNSSVTFINTNVAREGSVRSANASGLLFNIKNKTNKYFIDGGGKMSSIREEGETTKGYFFDTSLGKSSGNWQYELGYRMADENYDINDLGFQRQNNYQRVYGNISYRIFEPNKTFRRYSFFSWANIRYRQSDGVYTGNHMGINFNATTLKQFSFGTNINGNVGKQYDYYEPRIEGRYYKHDPRLNFNGWISSDYSKKFAIDVYGFYGIRVGDDQKQREIEIEPRYRFTDKFQINYSLSLGKGQNVKGYVDELDDGSIIFGVRDGKDITNSLSGQYNFGVKSALALTFRHYWSPITYDSQYFQLEDDGTLTPNSYTGDNDINYNVWNLDLSYTWEFAPGSQLIALYRNNIFNEDTKSQLEFDENLQNLFKQPGEHNISLKLIYYIDYNNAKNWFKKSS